MKLVEQGVIVEYLVKQEDRQLNMVTWEPTKICVTTELKQNC